MRLWLWERHKKYTFAYLKHEHRYRLIIPLYNTRNVFRNWRAASVRKWQAWLFLLFPCLLQGVWKVPPSFLNIDLMIRFCMIGLWTWAIWFQTGIAKQNTEQVTVLLWVLFKVTTREDTTQESESVSLKNNQKRSSQSCNCVTGSRNLCYDGVKYRRWLPVFKL